MLVAIAAVAMVAWSGTEPPASKPGIKDDMDGMDDTMDDGAILMLPPAVGDAAPDFELKTLKDDAVKLSALTAKGPVVLLVLRGWPEYQCPLCTRQMQAFITQAETFAKAKATVLLVYPGPADGLKAHAQEFMEGTELPENFRFVIDPGYVFTNLWRLRWEAEKETAYPSTFVIDTGGIVRHATISKTHGGRTKADDIVKVVQSLP
jgi:peroxiredoxin